MSDTYYREQAARRSRMIMIAALATGAVVCVLFGVYSVLRDTCTGSFDRQPRSIVESYVKAVARGDADTAAACWQHLAYLDLETGCSEGCLSRSLGKPFEIQDIQLGEPNTDDSGRARIIAQVTAACPDGTSNTAEITLDSIRSNVPWRHWKIVQSSYGGTLSRPWCQ